MSVDHVGTAVKCSGDCADIRIMSNELRRLLHSSHGVKEYVLGSGSGFGVPLVAYYSNSVYGSTM